MTITTDTTNTITDTTAELERFERMAKDVARQMYADYPDDMEWCAYERLKHPAHEKVKAGALSAADAAAELMAALEAECQHWHEEFGNSRSASAKESESKTLRSLRKCIPKEYLQPIVRSRLPNPRAFDEVQGWLLRWMDTANYDDDRQRGIIAVGTTGQAKTRSLVQLIVAGFTSNHWGWDDKWALLFLPATQLKRAATIYAGKPGIEKDERREAEELIETARECDVLLLDDLSQPKFTPAYAEVLYEIVEHRTSHRLDNFITLQLGRDEFLAKVSDGNAHLLTTAEAIFRRLSDYCDVIDFDDADGTYDHVEWMADWIQREYDERQAPRGT